MNCWKSINLDKHYGLKRINLISCFIGLIAFILLYVPFSMLHLDKQVQQVGILVFIIAIVLLPTLHSFMHILPLIIMNRRINLKITRKKVLPIFTFYIVSHISKKNYIISLIMPSLLITIPCIVAGIIFPMVYVYALLIAAVNIGLSFLDFLTIRHLWKAPNNAYVENGEEGFDILLKAN
ncbi:DUF3267 domain-containing protein [Ornithinibacillus scapharcae]|uniref:DUF3267 domain-containing protein n=1 Tax=Ornithinibacillus scapharcae TaxID=1147159 RepID=UPI000225B7AD|nr:DUF3267 domain-containing protein [Ornithinibacillus scapharcae]